jgi:hypothetical protein
VATGGRGYKCEADPVPAADLRGLSPTLHRILTFRLDKP